MEPRADQVLTAAPPRCSPDRAVAIAREVFGVVATSAQELGSERDQAFGLLGDGPGWVLKISNALEDPDTLDMEAQVVAHAHRVDSLLPLARPRTDANGAARAVCEIDGERHWVRCYDRLAGRARSVPTTYPDTALADWGAMAARLDRALRSFHHPRAHRTMLWDVQHAASVRPMVDAVADPQLRSLVERSLDRFDRLVTPRWDLLRHQVVHGDLTSDNALVDDNGTITGIVDFGDMSHTALVIEITSVLDSLCLDRSPADTVRVARLVLDGYERVTPLDPDERFVLGPLWATRAAVGIAIAAWRAAEGLEDPVFAERYRDRTARMLAVLDALGDDGLTGFAEPGAPAAGTGPGDLVQRRSAAFGPVMESLSYRTPIEVASAEGVWLTATDGTRYLDCYNNVPCVGHAHPRVAGAIARQARVLNTNMRYLHRSAIELAERMLATCPPSLDTVLFVNSGSEANDVAWRLATAATGQRGGLCTWFAYHGITEAIAAFSPETLRPDDLAHHVERWRPPDALRGDHLGHEEFTAALERLGHKGLGLAATILDGVLQSDGVLDLEPSYVRRLVELTRAAGGLWIADEVQGGHGRTGTAMWSFERFGIEPEFVTCGKPMGNGHPVAAVITRRDIAARFAGTSFFSTFGGNQVSVAAAHAVLDVLHDEQVLPRVVEAGEALRHALRTAADGHPQIAEVRGMGLANGVEIVRPDGHLTPDPEAATALREALKQRGVLVGTTGPHGNVLKVRPPLAFTSAHATLVGTAFAEALDRLGAGDS